MGQSIGSRATLPQIRRCGTRQPLSSRVLRRVGGAMTDAAVNPLKAGLEDVVVSPSEICFIDGHKGRLIYRGYDVDDLVAHSTFEEVTFLLWQGRLPSRKELDTHLKALASTANRKLPPKLLAMLKL